MGLKCSADTWYDNCFSILNPVRCNLSIIFYLHWKCEKYLGCGWVCGVVFIWSGKLWSMLVTSHWRLSPLLSSRLRSLFHILTVPMVSPRAQESHSHQLIQCELKQWPCAWLTASFLSHDRGLAGSLGTRANSSQFHLHYSGISASSPIILKLKEGGKSHV